jgi:hypothetical protein
LQRLSAGAERLDDTLGTAGTLDASRGTAHPIEAPSKPAMSAKTKQLRVVIEHLTKMSDSLGAQAGKPHDLDSDAPVA